MRVKIMEKGNMKGSIPYTTVFSIYGKPHFNADFNLLYLTKLKKFKNSNTPHDKH